MDAPSLLPLRVPGEKAGAIAFGEIPAACGNVKYATPYFAGQRTRG